MKPEKFMVIGSNSFSGASFIEYVLRDNPAAEVVGIGRSPEHEDCLLPYKQIKGAKFGFFRLDLNKDLDGIMGVVKDFRPDYIVNFAAQGMVAESWKDPKQWFQTNCVAVVGLADRLTEEAYLKRYVQVSSPEVYGPCRNVTEESAKFNPSTPYAASKAAGDLGLYPFFLHKGFPLVYTRGTNVYGPYQQVYRIIPRTVLSVKAGVKVMLQGGGRAVKSYIHIKDVCDATLKIARYGRNGEVYHISPDGDGISIYDLVKTVCAKMGRDMEECVESTGDRLGQDAVYAIDSSKVRKELGWRPGIDLESGIDGVIEWVERYYDELMKLPQTYIHKP